MQAISRLCTLSMYMPYKPLVCQAGQCNQLSSPIKSSKLPYMAMLRAPPVFKKSKWFGITQQRAIPNHSDIHSIEQSFSIETPSTSAEEVLHMGAWPSTWPICMRKFQHSLSLTTCHIHSCYSLHKWSDNTLCIWWKEQSNMTSNSGNISYIGDIHADTHKKHKCVHTK